MPTFKKRDGTIFEVSEEHAQRTIRPQKQFEEVIATKQNEVTDEREAGRGQSNSERDVSSKPKDKQTRSKPRKTPIRDAKV